MQTSQISQAAFLLITIDRLLLWMLLIWGCKYWNKIAINIHFSNKYWPLVFDKWTRFYCVYRRDDWRSRDSDRFNEGRRSLKVSHQARLRLRTVRLCTSYPWRHDTWVIACFLIHLVSLATRYVSDRMFLNPPRIPGDTIREWSHVS